MCLGTAVLTSGVARASTTLVLSDTITFSGIVRRGRLETIIQVQKCSLTSDGEQGAFVCQAQGTVNNFGPPTGTFNSQSADGQIQANFFESVATNGTFKWKGSATEMDAPDPGQPQPAPYTAAFKGFVTETGGGPLPVTITGKLKVRESPTSP
jgi:hypothetical protein